MVDVEIALSERDRATAFADDIARPMRGRAGPPAPDREQADAPDRSGSAGTAIATCQALVEKSPEDPAARLRLADALRKAGDIDAADAQYAEVLRRRPGHKDALQAAIDVALERQDLEVAHARSLDLQSRFPGKPFALRRHASVLRQMGRLDEAVRILRDVVARLPQDPGARMQLAHLLRANGDLRAAGDLYVEVLDRQPAHKFAAISAIDVALALCEYGTALARSEAAISHAPGDADLLRRRAKALRLLNRFDDAADLLREIIAAAPDDPVPRMQLAGVLRAIGDLAAADAIYAEVLAARPDHKEALAGAIDVALSSGDVDAALARSDSAALQFPAEIDIGRKRARVLRAAGRSEEAAALARAIVAEAPDDPASQLVLASVLRDAGDPVGADAAYAKLLRLRPDDVAAILGRVDLAVSLGHCDRAWGILDDALDRPAIDAGPGPSPAAGLILKVCELASHVGDPDRLKRGLNLAEGALDRFSAPQLIKLAVIGEQFGRTALASAALSTALAGNRISPAAAMHVVRRGLAKGPSHHLDGLAEQLAARLSPEQRNAFKVEVDLLRFGPEPALEAARRVIGSPRGAPDAARVARLLREAKRSALAFRYVRLCRRRWPHTSVLRNLLIDLAVDTGRLDHADALLTVMEAADPPIDCRAMRVRLLWHQGRHAAALEVADELAREGKKTPTEILLRLHLSLEDLDGARRVLRDASEYSYTRMAHLKASHVGSLLNELDMYQRETKGRCGPDEGADDETLCQGFYFAAKRVIDRRVRNAPAAPAREGSPEIPRQVFQYWDSRNIPPQVSGVMASWRASSSYRHTVFDRRSAQAYLRESFGPDHVRAFRLAGNVAEECDFLRLCLLYREGGIYADADDRLVGDPDQLRAEARGMLLFREPLGAISNNVMCACPGHPLLERAVDMAFQSLLARENDGTWSKTGPGLLTRAAAAYILGTLAGEPDHGMTILPHHRLYRHVSPHVRLPYKSTAKYWNASVRASSGSAADILQLLAPSPTADDP
ncbi:tetratricopeptide repeat protein [Acuticoccus sediminis]|uniref:tetratricopeptide repeat protein n=1 Tax=Acuticoccus sediminis TaxID=2184697 RepID=UPI001CFCBF3C|nr:tetratricopeptide repeat protein [Acuticoccus sediminis]